MSIVSKCIAEFIGTFWLVFGGCGSAVLAAIFLTSGANPLNIGIGLVGVSLAFGLTVLTMAYAIGHISGCHLNPAVSAGLVAGGRFSVAEFVPYVISQVVGGLAGAVILYLILSGKASFTFENFGASGFACNGYDDHSPDKYNMASCFAAEFVLTFFFLIIILGTTDGRAPSGFAGIAIGLALTLIHLIGIPVTNLSVNPARSTGPAIVLGAMGGEWWAVAQLWLFWAAPIAGAVAAGVVYNIMTPKSEKTA